MNKPLPAGAPSDHRENRTPRTEAVRELEQEVIDLFSGCERALLMTEDLADDFFISFSKDVGKPEREGFIMLYFEQNRIRTQILHDILFRMHATAKALDTELRKSAKEE